MEKLLYILLPVLITLFCWRAVNRKLKERESFLEAAREFREVFDQALADIDGGTPMNDENIKTHRVAYLNFRPYLHGPSRLQYDGTWSQYCDDCENINQRGMGLRITRADIRKDIESLLEFTEYKMLRNVRLLVKRLWSELHLIVWGSNKT